jgi:hypothetical protein
LTGRTLNSEGQIVFSSEFAVSRQTKPKEIVDHFTNKNIECRDPGNGWTHYSIRNIQLKDTYFNMTFYFDNDVLKMTSFVVSDKIIVESSWDDWSEKSEMKKRNFYDNWLTKEIGKNRKFEWGTIGAFYDNKGGFSSIVLNYK